MKRIFYLATAASLMLASCGDKDEDESPITPIDSPIEEPTGKGDVTDALDNAEAQKKLEGYATEFINSFKPEDQDEAITTLTNFADILDELGSPEQWDEEEPVSKKCFVADYAKNVSAALSKNDYSKATEVNEEFVFNFDEYAGIYEEDMAAGTWKYTESNDIVFKFKDDDGKDCEFKAVKADGEVSESFTTEGETYKISAPSGATITLTHDGKEVMKTVADVQYESRKSMKVVVNLTIANLTATSNTIITNTEISDNQAIAIDGKPLVYTQISAKGNHFTDIDNYESIADDEDVEINPKDYVTSLDGKVDVMGNVQIKYAIALSDYFDNADAFDYADDKASVEAFCADWNKSFAIKFFYSGTKVEQGNIKLQPILEDSWGDEEIWDVQPVVEFEADGKSFAFEDYFNQDKFANTDSQFEALWDKYEAYWE
ncbi:MAG: hypothetical protein K6F33_06295 [Bacteroidales bacterium]|nr:hypothetical protein [Bacteroidales bacterium]